MNEHSSSSERILDAAAIMDVLPHRYPFLLVDRIQEWSSEHVVGTKGVTVNEPFFAGHFPDRPVMPGVLVVEGLGQTGAVGLLQKESSSQSAVHLAAIEEARFRRPVVPGDTLTYRVEFAGARRGFVRLEGIASVAGDEAARATITLSIQSNDNL